MTKIGALLVVLAMGCSRPAPTAVLQAQAAAIVRSRQPALEALVGRVAALKRLLRGNLPGWEAMLRNAEAANDALGLQPFTQSQPPGPGWRPSPASVLGMGPYVLVRARQLAEQGKVRELEFLVEDEQRRYRDGIADVDRRLAQIERWLAAPDVPRD
ncbi:MAG TPA: hypothetical protein VF469_06615 [Kofleriaceae bacterium]